MEQIKEKIYDYISARGGAIASDELVQNVLATSGASSVIADRIVQASVVGDKRFVRDDSGRWSVVQKKRDLLKDTRFILCQITPRHVDNLSQVLAITCCKIRGNAVTGQRVWWLQWRVDSNDHDQDLIPAEAVFEELHAYFQDDVLVMDGHGNQVSTIHSGMRWAVGDELENQFISMRKIITRFSEGSGLSSLAELSKATGTTFFESDDPAVNMKNFCDVFFALLDLIENKDIHTLDDLLEFCFPPKQQVDFTNYNFDREYIDNLPPSPGVYIMRNKDGEVIYVGKSKNLHRRVGSYFLSREVFDQKTQQILDGLCDLEVKVLGSELEALLEEQFLIEKYQPRINRQFKVHCQRQSNLNPQIIFLPSQDNDAVELFLLTEGWVDRIRALKDKSNLTDVEIMISKYFEMNKDTQTRRSTLASGEIISRWLSSHMDDVTSLDLRWIPDMAACIQQIKKIISVFRNEKTIYV